MSETDFVSGNADFHKFGQELALHVASMPAKDNAELLEQEYVRDPSKKIKDLLKEAVLKFGENIKIGKFTRWELGL
jgi:elongation factor Ts